MGSFPKRHQIRTQQVHRTLVASLGGKKKQNSSALTLAGG